MALILLNVNYLYPMPEGVTFEDTEKFGEYIAELPLQAFLMVFAAHFGQSIVGGYVAAKIGSHPMVLAHIIGILTLLGSLVNNLQIPGVPLWTWIEIPFYPVLAYWVGKYVEQQGNKAKEE